MRRWLGWSGVLVLVLAAACGCGEGAGGGADTSLDIIDTSGAGEDGGLDSSAWDSRAEDLVPDNRIDI